MGTGEVRSCMVAWRGLVGCLVCVCGPIAACYDPPTGTPPSSEIVCSSLQAYLSEDGVDCASNPEDCLLIRCVAFRGQLSCGQEPGGGPEVYTTLEAIQTMAYDCESRYGAVWDMLSCGDTGDAGDTGDTGESIDGIVACLGPILPQ